MSDNPVRGLIVPFKKGQNQWSKRGIGVRIDMSWGWLPCLHSKEAFVLHTAPVWGRIALQIKMRGRYGIGRFLSCQFCLLHIWDEINKNLVLVIYLSCVYSKEKISLEALSFAGCIITTYIWPMNFEMSVFKFYFIKLYFILYKWTVLFHYILNWHKILLI